MFTEQFQKYDFPLLGLVRLPQVKITDAEKNSIGINLNCSNYEFLRELTKQNFQKNEHKLSNPDAYQKRAQYELEIFEELGFTDYVLLVWKVINKLKELGGYRDAGRGSCVGSFVFALIGITGVLDVIDKGLIFERFISRVRSKKEIIDGTTYLHGDLLCDADLNLGGCRQDIIDWLKQEYQGKICKIAAFSTLTSKILIKDIYKTYDEVNEDEAKRVADMIEKQFGIVNDIEETIKENKEFKKWSEAHPKTFEICLQLRDLLRQKTSHASGYFISYYDLDGFVPVELNKDKELSLAYEMNDASQLGTKLDLLGLTQCEILTEFFKTIPEKPDDIELDTNPIVYEALQKDFLPYGLYQISADCAKRVTNKVRPKNISELSDINAIARPGALDYLDSYVDGTVKSPHKIFDDIVKETRGLFLYQEQLMKAIVAIGFTLDDAEIVRKIVGKKQKKEFPKWEQKIKDKIKENNLPSEVYEIVWKVLNDSSGYSFNKSHSLGVSYLGALTVWAKYKYPLQFYTACLNSAKNQPAPTDEIAAIENELKYFNIKLLPPDIIKSKNEFTIEDGNIRFSLQSIKGIANKTLEKIQNFKHEYSSKFDIFNAANEAKLGIGVLSALIQSGCLSSYCKDITRSQLVKEAQLYNLLTDKEKKRVIEIGEQFNYDLVGIIKYLSSPQNGSEKSFIKNSRMETIRKKFKGYYEIYKQNSKNEKLAQNFYEFSLLGFTFSDTLYSILKEEYKDVMPINQVIGELDNTKVQVCGRISDIRSGTSKNKNKYIKAKLEDGSGNSINIMIMERNFSLNEELNDGKKLEDGDIIMAEGTKKPDIIFCDKIVSQKIKIYQKLSELKNSEKI
jgi:DNA polymerase III alpha subunit